VAEVPVAALEALRAEAPQGLVRAEPPEGAPQGRALAVRPVREAVRAAFLGLALPARHRPARWEPAPESPAHQVQELLA
jgi:hypothetical protein